MIGDWIENIFPIRIESFIELSYIEYKENEYKPITLTTEILKKNGFDDYGDIFEYHFEDNGDKYKFYIKKMYDSNGVNDAWGTNICGVIPSVIKYVHELQHALRLCGLNELADNFKINNN